jgi:mRNA interferase RelE/StbE
MAFVTRKPSEGSLPDFRVFETDEFLKRLKKLPSTKIDFLRKKFDSFVYPQIKKEPFRGNNIKKLKGYSPDTWRYRIGKFRLFYIIDQNEQIIYMLTVDDRKNAYK